MTDDALNMSDLPSTIPIFPLPGVIMLPGSNLPLNIFEPRYLQMIKDARAASGLIGMVQPLAAADISAAPETYLVGGAGRISHYAETEDRRNIIRLTGICRFKVARELDVMTPYRQVQPCWQTYRHDLDAEVSTQPFDRATLMVALKAYLEQKGLAADYDGIDTAPDSVLINTLSMIIPFGGPEKQALLEANNTEERGKTLQSLLIMMTSATLTETTGRPS